MYKKVLMNKSIDAMICDIEKKHNLFFLKYLLRHHMQETFSFN
jgi:hypothetical protein